MTSKLENILTLMNMVPDNKSVLFACIGTDRSTGDALGPLVGTFLEEKGYEVIGTLDNPLHALVIDSTAERIKREYSNHIVIAIDACLSRIECIGDIVIEEGSILPGKAVNKKLTPIGHVAIKGIVNVAGYQEYTVLQNTRLGMVMNMAKEITDICEHMMKSRDSSIEVAVS